MTELLKITIGIDPNVFNIAGLLITWHGIFTAVGIVAGVWLAVRVASSPRVGIDPDTAYTIGMIVVACGLVGARALYVVENYGDNSNIDSFIDIFRMTEGGISIWGAMHRRRAWRLGVRPEEASSQRGRRRRRGVRHADRSRHRPHRRHHQRRALRQGDRPAVGRVLQQREQPRLLPRSVAPGRGVRADRRPRDPGPHRPAVEASTEERRDRSAPPSCFTQSCASSSASCASTARSRCSA